MLISSLLLLLVLQYAAACQGWSHRSFCQWKGSTSLFAQFLTIDKEQLIQDIKGLEKKPDLGMGRVVASPDGDTEIEPLLNDIDMLAKELGRVIQRENEEVYTLYEKFRAHALKRAAGDDDALGRMIACAYNISADNALGVVRAFTETLNLVNAAEVHHRTRLQRNADIASGRLSPLPSTIDSVAGSIDALLLRAKEDPDMTEEEMKEKIYAKLLKQKVDIVLTAHPTEVNRRTLLRKYRSVSELLFTLDGRDLSPFERQQLLTTLRRQIASIWGSDEIRRQKPSPQQEARGGLAILESVLWDAVPTYLRKLSLQLEESLGRPLPVNHTPIRFSSWMGGDRDGNPNVTPAVTYEISITQRLQAAKLHLNDVVALYRELAIFKGFSPAMKALAAAVEKSFDRRELYRRVLGHVRDRLLATIEWCESELAAIGVDLPTTMHVSTSGDNHRRWQNGNLASLSTSLPASIDPGFMPAISCAEVSSEEIAKYKGIAGDASQPILDANDLLRILTIMHDSLAQGGYADVADGLLLDVIRRVNVFGMTLAPLDIRQESGRHAMTLDAITQYLGLGSYASWEEAHKISWLMQELSSKRPLFNPMEIDSMGFDPLVMDVLQTFAVMARLGPGSLGAYVISQACAASDVLAVMLLQKQFGMTPASGRMIRVVPLFETLADLNNATGILRSLFALPAYPDMINRQQEVMVGYSDSAKDAGRLAASWAQYESQSAMVRLAEAFGIQLTFFHGKGGTVGRGGNPALFRAVLAHPPRSINGRFRVTEQGEMITQNFGSTNIAERTLDIYTAAVLYDQFTTSAAPKERWMQCMERISDVSCAAYRQMLRDANFIKYFKTATPLVELGSLNIGSRPTKRSPQGGIESLRAIPWTFAWTQTRMHFPAWMGVGEALDPQDSSIGYKMSDLQEMYQQWPFFRETIDLIAMVLSKTDYSISANYEKQLLLHSGTEKSKESTAEERNALLEVGESIRAKLVQTRKAILKVTGCDDLSGGFRLLQVSMRVRYPYVDPLNVLQAELLRRLRDPDCNLSEEEKQLLQDAVVVSINGIAQGMKNSG